MGCAGMEEHDWWNARIDKKKAEDDLYGDDKPLTSKL